MVPVIVAPSKSKQFLALFLGFVMLAASLFALIDGSQYGIQHGGLKGIVGGALGTAFFGIAIILIIIKLFSTKPLLVVDEKGITNKSNFGQGTFVPWDQVGQIGIYSLQVAVTEQKFISIWVKDPAAYHENLGVAKRAIDEYNAKLNAGNINISVNNFSQDPNEVVRQMQDWHSYMAGCELYQNGVYVGWPNPNSPYGTAPNYQPGAYPYPNQYGA